MRKKKTVKSHLITAAGWLLCFYILYFYQTSCSYSPYTSTHLVVGFIHTVGLLGCSYLLKRHLISKFLYNRKLLKFTALLLLLIVVVSNIMQGLAWAWYNISGSLDEKSLELIKEPFYQIFTSYLVVTFGCIIIIALRVLSDQWMSQTRYAQLQKEKAQTELNFLKAQINPHFLFNSINSIFAHIDKSNVAARQIVLKFSEMLRYQLYECNAEAISFEKEFAYLNNYVELQRLRKEENLKISVETSGEMQGFEIAPLLIVPFIENAFKYASNHDDRENILKIILTKYPDYFNFYCLNTKDRMVSRNLPEKGGIGINNVKRRLELLYPGRHELQIADNDLTFEVNMKIEIV